MKQIPEFLLLVFSFTGNGKAIDGQNRGLRELTSFKRSLMYTLKNGLEKR